MDLLSVIAAAADGAAAGQEGAEEEVPRAARINRKSLRQLDMAPRLRIDRRRMIPVAVREERMKKCRFAKRLKNVAHELTAAKGALQPTRAAWNSTQLRFRDHAASSRKDKVKKLQLKQWTVHGTMKLAFTLVQPSLLSTCRYLDARGCVAYAHLHLQAATIRRSRDEHSRHDWMFMQRCFDETPAHLSFGLFAPELAPVARYKIPAKHRAQFDGQATASLKDLEAVGAQVGRHGVVDFVESATTVLACGEAFDILIPTRVLKGKKSQYTFQALDHSIGGHLSMADLIELVSSMSLILLVDTADAAGSNRKAMACIGSKLPDNILYVANKCVIHQVFRCIVAVLTKLQVMQSLF